MPLPLLTRRALLGLLGLGGLMTVPDFPDEKAPDAHATAISLTGAPPLVLKRVIDAQIGTSIPASGTLTRPATGAFSLNQPGYEIQINVGAIAATAPVISVELQWFDSAFGGLIDSEIYYFYSGDANGHQIHGRGPSKGDQVVVIVKNYSSAAGVSFSYTLLQTSRTFTREFWKTITKGTTQPLFPGFTPALGNIESNVLISQGVSLGAGTSSSKVLPLYTGTVRLFGLTSSTTAGKCTWVLNNNTDQVAGGGFNFQGSNGQSGFAPLGVSNLYASDIAMPRGQCTMVLTNNDSATELVSVGMFAQEDRA